MGKLASWETEQKIQKQLQELQRMASEARTSQLTELPTWQDEPDYELEEEITNTTKKFSLNSKKQENNLIDAIKIVCRKHSKVKTGKKPFTNINIVRI